jgi:hypothetical protein
MTANHNPNPPAVVASCRRWGPPYLIPGEDSAAFDELFVRVVAAVRPADTVEEILLGNFVDLEWEILRWRRLKASHITNIACQHLTWRSPSFNGKDKLLKDWAARKPRAVKRLDRILKSEGLNMDEIVREALYEGLEEIKRIEAMIATAEARRNATLREIGRHRASFVGALRRALPQLEDAEYQAIEVDAAEAKSAA